ncbi:MAG: hypothetical protein AAFW83_06735 [Pseudomonadota bacterium]
MKRTQSDLQFIEAAYKAVEGQYTFVQMAEAWDGVMASLLAEDYVEEAVAAHSRETFYDHFRRALHLFESTQSDRQVESNINAVGLVASQPTAALAADAQGRVIAVNPLAQQITGLQNQSRLDALRIEADGHRRLRDALHNDLSEPIVVRGVRSDSDHVLIFVVQAVELQCGGGKGAPSRCLLIKTTETAWRESIGSTLQSAFQLTDTECDLVRNLNEGKNLDEIADARDRSIYTVRTQINSILQKTRTHTRSDLMRLVTALLHVLPETATSESTDQTRPLINSYTKAAGDGRQSDQAPWLHRNVVTYKTISLDDGRLLEFAECGAPNGAPILGIFPTTPPVFPTAFTDQLAAEQVRLIVPIKAGIGSLTTQVADAGASLRTPDIAGDPRHLDYATLLKRLKIKRCGLAAHCSGGPLALHFADRYPDRVSRLLLIDVGSPIVDLEAFKLMTPNAARTFFAARIAPHVLFVPHAIARDEFYTNKSQADAIIDYFYADHAADVKALKNSSIKSFAHDMLGYSFSSVEQLIRDISIWVSDWHAIANRIIAHKQTRFVQGDKNLQMPVDSIRSFIKNKSNASLSETEGAAQLQLYTHPEKIAEQFVWVAAN